MPDDCVVAYYEVKTMRLKVLVDNNTYIDKYFSGEPALSFYIEIEDKRILFDTGYSDIVLRNADKMGIDLKQLTHIVVSHGHNDHSNGLKYLVEEIGIANVKLIAHQDCFLPKMDGDEYIGAPYSKEEIQELTQYLQSETIMDITEQLIYLGEIPRKNDFESKEPIGKQQKNGKWEDDYLLDDTALVYKGLEGIFIITGCSHSGICNIIEYAKEICDDDRVLGVLGGFHLFEDNEQLQKTIDYLVACQVKQLYPCHCVSLVAKAKMMNQLPVLEVGVGMEILIEV